MSIRHHAQRKHIIQSLDSLLYQLHVLSFFMAPALWPFIFRLIYQLQCSKPLQLDPTRSLRYLFFISVAFNSGALWGHAVYGQPEGRAVVLDFVGLSYVPSKLQLLSLDLFILFLQLLLVTISYETALSQGDTDTQDTLLPVPSVPLSDSPPPSPSSLSPSSPLPSHLKTPSSQQGPEYIIDVRLAPIIERLRNPAPRPRVPPSDTGLPLPNTTPWPLPAGMRLLIRASSQMRADARNAQEDMAGPRGERRVPGAMQI
ncbi:hypothetical protein AX16_000733 [Volvariella volvacea WC 439]|nr:hypothetical protein AX16_000733 [Volvariella volvacea WC 439]